MKGGIQLRGEEQGKDCLVPFRDTLCAVSATLLSIIFSACLFFACPAIGQSAKEPAGKLRTITTAREAHDLTSEEAARGYPVHLHGVVTYYDPSIGSKRAVLFVHDATGGIYAELVEGSIEDLTPGTLVDVRGVSGAGEFAPIVNHPQIKVIGHATLPANASRENLSRLKSGALDGQWIEAEGVIRSFVAVGDGRRDRNGSHCQEGGRRLFRLGRCKSTRPCQCRPDVQPHPADDRRPPLLPRPFRNHNCGGSTKRSLQSAHYFRRYVIALGPGQ